MGSRVRERLTGDWLARYESRDSLDESQRFTLGVDLFNNDAAWHAHEVWEELWQEGSRKRSAALQALIQLAASMVHWRNKNRHGAYTLLHRCRGNLAQEQGSIFGSQISEIKEKTDKVLTLLDAGAAYGDGPPVRLEIDGEGSAA